MIAPRPDRDPPPAVLRARPTSGPTVQRIVLGAQLRRLREARHITREAAGAVIRASDAKICRLELGRTGFKERDVADLLTSYGVDDASVREEFLQLARQANTPGWWRQYSDILSPWFETHLGLEEAASLIRTYEVQFIPGLLQTADYAEAVTRLGFPTASKEETRRRVALRMTRQEHLARPDAPKLWAVIDEAALRRPLGGRAVMRAQLEHLIQACALPNVTLQILPFHVGGHAAAGGPVTILRFPVPDLPDIVYLEQLSSALYLDKRTDVDTYMSVMDRISLVAAPLADTVALLEKIIEETSTARP